MVCCIFCCSLTSVNRTGRIVLWPDIELCLRSKFWSYSKLKPNLPVTKMLSFRGQIETWSEIWTAAWTKSDELGRKLNGALDENWTLVPWTKFGQCLGALPIDEYLQCDTELCIRSATSATGSTIHHSQQQRCSSPDEVAGKLWCSVLVIRPNSRRNRFILKAYN